MKRYEFQGIENLEYICDFCGKNHISRCFVVFDNDTGETLRFGSTCIVKALSITMSEVKAMAREKIEQIRHEYNSKIYALSEKSDFIMREYRKANNYPIGFLPESETSYWELKREEQSLESEMWGKIHALEW